MSYLQDSAKEARRLHYLLPAEPSAATVEAVGLLEIPASCNELGNDVVDARGIDPAVPRILRADSKARTSSLTSCKHLTVMVLTEYHRFAGHIALVFTT